MRGRNPFDGKPQLTLRDVAEAAGVSEMTVSRVLRNRGDVSEKTRERVFAASRALGYVPNKIAGALASNRVNLVGVVVPSISNLVFPDVLAGIGEVLDDTALQPVMGSSLYDPEREEKVIFEMLSWRPSGLIVAGIEHTDAARAMMRNAGIPVVEVMDVDGEPVAAMVGISHEAAGLAMAREVMRRGYRKIGYCGTNETTDHRAQKRLAGFERGLAEAGLSLIDRRYYEGNSSFGSGREMTVELLSANPDLDFIYYNTDLTAAGGLIYCLETGRSIPDDLGLAGFNGFEMIASLPMRLATMDSRRREIGQEAARLIAAGEMSDARIVLEPRVIEGDTLRKA